MRLAALLLTLGFALPAGGTLPRELFSVVGGSDGPPRDHYTLYQAGGDPVFPDYPTGVRWAREDGRPLVVFVGVRARAVPGCVACEAPSLPPFPAGIVVSFFKGGEHLGEHLGAATDADVARALSRHGVRPAELPAPAPVFRPAPPAVPASFNQFSPAGAPCVGFR